MAPARSTQKGRDRIAEPILSFASSLRDRLNRGSKDATLDSELQSHINTLRTSGSAISSSRREDLDQAGTNLWNVVTRLKREQDQHDAKRLCLAQVFAFYLVNSAHAANRNKFQSSIRLLRLANKAVKFCLEHNCSDLSSRLLERAADLDQFLEHHKASSKDNASLSLELRVEYSRLRITQAWKQNKLDLAESLSSKLESPNIELDAGASEQAADLYFEIGRSLHRNGAPYEASKWLEKSYHTLAVHDLDKLSPNASDLNLSILHYLVRSLIAYNTDGAREKAETYLNAMDSTYANKMAISLCRLEFLSTASDFNPESYYNALHRMIRTIHLTQGNFKTLMHHVHKLKDHDRNSADQALEDLSVQRLYAEKDRTSEWIEKVLIMRLWIMADSDRNHDSALKFTNELVRSVYGVIARPMSTSGTHAAQTLLWKRIEDSAAQRNFQVTIAWCNTLLHEIFGNSGDFNRAKILRKIILCSIASHDTHTAREAFNQMSETGRAFPMSRYLMYKVGLKDQDTDLVSECLESLCQSSSKDTTMLYACVLEAQTSGDKVQAVYALQRVVKKFDYNAPDGVHLPSLLRCTARLLISEISPKNQHGCSTNAPEELAALFEGASRHIRPAQARNENVKVIKDFTPVEIDWFARNSYNLALNNFTEWDSATIVTLLGACQVFIEHLTAHSDETSTLPDLRKRSLSIHCLLSQAILRMARREDNEQKKLQYYLRISSCTKTIRNLQSDQSFAQHNGTDRNEVSELWKKQLVTEFEAAIHLKVWDGLIRVIDDCKVFQEKKIYDGLADMLLASEAPATILISTLEHLINTTININLVPLHMSARWLRILYQLSADSHSSTPSTETIITRALNLMDTASNTPGPSQQRAASTHPTNETSIYPPEEIEWLATTTFNRAVDAYCAADEENCRKLGDLALECAGRMPEAQGGGRLRGLLMERLGMLRWE